MHRNSYLMLIWMAASIITGIVVGLRLQRSGYLLLRRIIWFTIPVVIVLLLTAMMAVAFQLPDWPRIFAFWCLVALAMHFIFNVATGTTMLFRRDLRLPGLSLTANAAIIPIVAVVMMLVWQMVKHSVFIWARNG